MKPSRTLTLAASLLALALLAGCFAAKGHKLAATNSRQLATFSEKTNELHNTLAATTDALNALAASPDKGGPFKKFSQKTGDLDSAVKWFAQQSSQTSARHTQLAKEWDSNLDQIQNPDIRALLEKEKTQLLDTYAALPEKIHTAENALSALVGKLDDLQKLLALSISDETLRNAATVIREINTETTQILDQLQTLVTTAATLSKNLAAAAGSAAPKSDSKTQPEAPVQQPADETPQPAEPETSEPKPTTDPDHRPMPNAEPAN